MPDALWIGVDGGATNVRALAVAGGRAGELRALGPAVVRAFPPFAAPVALERQLGEARSGTPRLGAEEAANAAARSALCAEVAAAAARAAGASRVRVAVCLPGLPSADGAGLAVVKNGPRMPSFAVELERALGGLGLAALELAPLVGDGAAAAWGEHAAARGALAGAPAGLVLAAGTGLAEGWKVAGRVLADAERAERFVPAWRLAAPDGASFEEHLSLAGLGRRLRARGVDSAIEPALERGDPRALAELAGWARALCAFVEARRSVAPELGSVPCVLTSVAARLWRLARALAPEDAVLEGVRASELEHPAALGAVAAARWSALQV